ncbi:MAG TPA: hypothetical protein VGK73_40775, partial [Polyangiaceae bacterium]
RLEPSLRRATLVLREPGAEAVERSVEGDSCAELASGLAMIAALAFGAAEEPAETKPDEAPRTEEPRSQAPANPAPSPKAPERPPAATTGVRATGKANARPSRLVSLGLEVGAGGWLNTWSAPGLGLGADLFVRLGPQARGSWSLRVAGLYGFGSSSVGDRLAEFRLLGGRVEGCPLVDGFTAWFSGEGCVALDLGALGGRGDDSSALLAGSSDTMFWAATVVAGRVRARLGERVFLEGQGELGFPLVRHEFVFEAPRELIFRVPAAGVAARVGLGVQFL